MKTKPFQRIVVALDFSPHSDRALALAVDLARTLGARLELLHVMELPAEAHALYGVVFAETILDDVRAAAERRLDAPLAIARTAGIEARGHLQLPPVAPAIVELVRELGADLVVMGTRGRGGAIRALLGSVAARVVRTAPCAVLTVTAPEEAGDAPEGAPAR